MFLRSVLLVSILVHFCLGHNTTYQNPILPGFHPDPSCIFVPELDDTFFCASSSFLVFPGIPIHASKDLQNWKFISHVLNRPAQLPSLNTAKRATSGIWAPTLRYRNGTFYLVTTIVFDDYPKNATNRFDNLIFTTTDPFNSKSWSDPVHFTFPGYDTSPFWDDNGQVYITGTYAWEVSPGIQKLPIDISTGAVLGPTLNIWNGTGDSAPEGPHLYRKDGYYYLMIAEGGTGNGHMVTMSRSKNVNGPFEPHPHNPILTNRGTASYFQNLGHADLFEDGEGNWWAVALSVRQGPDGSYPMGRETVLTPVTWDEGEWPVFSNVSGKMSGWHVDPVPTVGGGEGSLVDSSYHSNFEVWSKLEPEFVHWRFPVEGNYALSKKGLQLKSSIANLTGMDGRSAEKLGQTFIARRQVHSLFNFKATFDVSALKEKEQEVGVSVFLDQLHHYDLGLVMLSSSSAGNGTDLKPYFRVRGITTVPAFKSTDLALIAVPTAWLSKGITFEIKAENITHYALSAGPSGNINEMKTIGYGNGLGLTWGFTGALLGVYATTNGRTGEFETYVLDWKYNGLKQVISN
ncbi:beta-xylosidase [Tricladium varicosporioides]|nr:beta-xylosidase [Hymenoscyphus varicosporioides]